MPMFHPAYPYMPLPLQPDTSYVFVVQMSKQKAYKA